MMVTCSPTRSTSLALPQIAWSATWSWHFAKVLTVPTLTTGVAKCSCRASPTLSQHQPLWRTTSTPSGKRPDRKPIPKPTCVLPLAILPGHPTAINPKSHPVSPAQPPLAQFLQPHPQGPGSPSNPPIRLGTAIAQFPSTPNHPTILGPTHPNALLPWWISPLDGHQFHLQPKNPPQPREALPAQPTRPVPSMPNASCVSGGVTQPCPVAAGRVSAFPVATSATCPEHVRHRIRVPVARQLPMADFPNT